MKKKISKTKSSSGTNNKVKRKKKVPKKKKPAKAPAVRTSSKSNKHASRFSVLLPDIEGITKRIIEGDLDHTQAMEVTSNADSLVDWAPNALSWCSDKRFLGMRPFAKQCEILLHLFEEYCVRCSDLHYLRDIPVADSFERVMSKVAMLEFGTCPHCGFTKADGRKSGTFIDPTELVAPWGQRSGKSAGISFAASYLVHRNLMLPVPWKEYGLLGGQILDFTFIATTKMQSEKTLWGQFKGLFTGSQWFKSYKEVCDLEGKKAGSPVTVKSLETYLMFGHKGILIYFAANDPASLRGSTRLGGAIDELSWFGNKEGGKRANGPEAYTSLNNSCLTLRQSVYQEIKRNPATTWPMPMMYNISSPVSMDDPLMSLYRDSADNPRAIRRHWATWEAHPTNTREFLTEIGEMAKPNAERDYGAQPPLAHNPLVRRTDIVTEAFKSPLALEERYGPIVRPYALGYTEENEVPTGARTSFMLSAGLQDNVQMPDFDALKRLSDEDLDALGPSRALFEDLVRRPPNSRMHIMGVDLGHTNNALGVVCGFLSNSGQFITDFAMEVKPRDRLTINIASVFDNLIVPLVEKLNVVAVFYDKWSSLSQIQDLANKFGSLGPLNDKAARRSWLRKLVKRKERPAFIADQYSLNMADALMLVSKLEQGDCLFPAMEVGFMDLMVNKNLDPTDYPYTHLALQTATVRRSSNRLLKPINRDDDIFRAWTNAVIPAFTNELVIDLLNQEYRAEPDKKANEQAFHVYLGQTGKGTRHVENMGTSTISTGRDTNFPVVVRKGGNRGNK